MRPMAGRVCLHCKEWVEEGTAHDCWTTTEAALTQDLSDDLRDAWERLRETAVEFGEQRIYASHSSVMFSRRACYTFVRPKAKYLEVCIFLGRPVNAPQIRNVMPTSKTKFAHLLRIVHRDEVEPPITDWMAEAYAFSGQQPPRATATRRETRKRAPRKTAKPATARPGKVRTRPQAKAPKRRR